MSENKNIDIMVLYCSDENLEGHFDRGFGINVKWDIPLLEGYKYKFLKNISWKPSIFNGFFGLINFQIFKELKNRKGSYLVLHSWVYATTYMTIIAAKIYGIKLCLRAENPLNQEVRKSAYVLFLRKIFFKYFFFRLFDYFFYIGEQNKQLYKYYDVEAQKLIFTPYAVDNDRLQKEYYHYKDKKADLRKELQIPVDKIVILFSGKFIDKKKPMLLLKAFREIRDGRAALIFLGEGVLRNEMETFIRENKLKNIFLAGFKNQTEVGKYFASADIFVLPSGMGETWGLVVNEAMNFALPVIINVIAGCTSDLVDETNGFIFKTGDELAEQLKTLINNPELIQRKGKASLKKIAEYSYDITIKNIKHLESSI
jgi:glycosyltransferase involved in cell wall biosynthesis